MLIGSVKLTFVVIASLIGALYDVEMTIRSLVIDLNLSLGFDAL